MIGFPKEKTKRINKKRKYVTEISKEVRETVAIRDNTNCIFCGKAGLPNMHYIARSQGGLGIEQNIACGCLQCHNDYDNGMKLIEYKEIFKEYLKSKYENWNEQDLIYRKEN